MGALSKILRRAIAWPTLLGLCQVCFAAGDALPAKETLRIDYRLLPEADKNFLPEGARAVLPARDMGPVSILLPHKPAAAVSVEDVRREIILPLLAALRVDATLRNVRDAAPGLSGLAAPPAKLQDLAPMILTQAKDPFAVQRADDLVAALQDKERKGKKSIEDAFELSASTSISRFSADLERRELHYRFVQLYENVPIEQAVLVASRKPEEDVSSVSGTVVHYAHATNRRPPDTAPAVVLRRAAAALGSVAGISAVDEDKIARGPDLVALPYGNVGGEGPQSDWIALRFCWRMILTATVSGRSERFLTWMDAESGEILKLQPVSGGADFVNAVGGIRRRGAQGAIEPRAFEIDADAAAYQLKHQRFSDRVVFGEGDPVGSGKEVSIPTGAVGSPPIANFNQPPINDVDKALCGGRDDTNTAFEQVQLFALMHMHWSQTSALNVFAPFPPSPWTAHVEIDDCNAESTMLFGACEGYYDPKCPNSSVAGDYRRSLLNYAHDNTVVGHELGHRAIYDLIMSRVSASACPPDGCDVPPGWKLLHDLADAWAAHFEDTNCIGGWVAKNVGGVDASGNCSGSRGHSDGAQLPRLLEVSVPFHPAVPGAHFPEHRDLDAGAYADGVIAGAALWEVRKGALAIDPIAGHVQYFVHLLQALVQATPPVETPADDYVIYSFLFSLETALINDWATAMPNHPTNKVLAGFAKAGLFAVSSDCIEDPGDGKAPACSSAEAGADAVIDIENIDLSSNGAADGALLPGRDYFKRGGLEPVFHVWTGPRYRFRKDDRHTTRPVEGEAPCNRKFIVELSNNPGFAGVSAVTRDSGWITINVDNGTRDQPNPVPQCYGSWSPTSQDWSALQAGVDKVYYRARTVDANGNSERLSTEPMHKHWTLAPPYAAIVDSGAAPR